MRKRNRLIILVGVSLLFALMASSGCSSLPPLHDAASRNNLTKANKIIQKGKTNINGITPDGKTALHYAARYGNLEMAKLLYDAGADLNKQCALSWTPLIEACYYEKYNVAEWLIKQGCNPTLKTNRGVTALYMACCYKYDRIVELLIPYSKSVLNDTIDGGFSCLYVACDDNYDSIPNLKQKKKLRISKDEFLQKQKKIVEMLLAAGADINQQTDYGVTALHHAIWYTNTMPVIEELLKNNASFDKRTNLGYLPLHTAAQQNNVQAFECLVQNGAKIQPMDSSHEITGRSYHLYADYLYKGNPSEQSKQYYNQAIQEYESAVEKNKAEASTLGKKILQLRAAKFVADLAMIALSAAASSASPTYNYYYVPGQLDLRTLEQRKKNCEEVVSRCKKWIKECKQRVS
jgi:ankyrin repeat protein